jgi:hypothetical protein
MALHSALFFRYSSFEENSKKYSQGFEGITGDVKVSIVVNVKVRVFGLN